MAGGFNTYAAGRKIYGGGRSNPTSGPVDKMGYRERDMKHKARKKAIMNRLKAKKQGRLFSSEYLGS
jgi:hypothetical protein